MRTFWITIAILLTAGLGSVMFIPSEPITGSAETLPDEQREALIAPSPRPAAQKAPATTPPPSTTATLALGLDQKIKEATVRPGRIAQENGSIVADGKFTIPGSGTQERPYEISWELLMSASDTYIPRLGEREIPQRIALLNGAYVRISGFIAFPLIATETDECLVMLNQWDGCCIGVPPSPYDAIEVRLLAPADNSKRHIVRVGSIEGIFHVDPYVMEKWLVGLYTMDHAVLSTEM